MDGGLRNTYSHFIEEETEAWGRDSRSNIRELSNK